MELQGSASNEACCCQSEGGGADGKQNECHAVVQRNVLRCFDDVAVHLGEGGFPACDFKWLAPQHLDFCSELEVEQKRAVLVVKFFALATEPFVDVAGVEHMVVKPLFVVLMSLAVGVDAIVIERNVYHHIAAGKCQGAAAHGKVFPAIVIAYGKQAIVDD